MLATTAVAKRVVTRTSVTAKIRRRGPSSAPVEEDSTSLSNMCKFLLMFFGAARLDTASEKLFQRSFSVLYRNYLRRNADGYLFRCAAIDGDADRGADPCERFFAHTFVFQFLHQRCHFRLATK